MTVQIRLAASLVIAAFAMPAAAQSSDCEIVLMPIGGSASDGQFSEAAQFFESVYDAVPGHMETLADMPVRAILCRRDNLVPTMRDLPLLKTGLPLSLSQDFDSTTSGLLTLYDAGPDFKAEYSGPELSADDKKTLRDTLEIFNLQKFIK